VGSTAPASPQPAPSAGLNQVDRDPLGERRRRHVGALADILGAVFRTRPAAEWLALLEDAGVPCAPVNAVADAVRSPQAAARNMIVGIDDPAIGRLIVAGNPVKLTGVPDPPARRAPPDLDADRAAILSWLDARSARA
jgi:CoA:oxalate CoA-transferase